MPREVEGPDSPHVREVSEQPPEFMLHSLVLSSTHGFQLLKQVLDRLKAILLSDVHGSSKTGVYGQFATQVFASGQSWAISPPIILTWPTPGQRDTSSTLFRVRDGDRGFACPGPGAERGPLGSPARRLGRERQPGQPGVDCEVAVRRLPVHGAVEVYPPKLPAI